MKYKITIIRFVCILLLSTGCYLIPQKVFAQEQITIPLDTLHWEKISCGNWQMSGNSLIINGTDYRIGGVVETKDFFDLSQSEIYIKWKVNGAGKYMAVNLSVGGCLLGNTTTNHSWNNSTVISDNKWYYTQVIFHSDTSFTAIRSTGDFYDKGGTLFDSLRETVTPKRWNLGIKIGKIKAMINDNYGGAQCSITLGYVMLKNAIKLSTSDISGIKTFDFEDGEIPTEINQDTNSIWEIADTGFRSNKSIYLEQTPGKTSWFEVNVANATKVSFDARFVSGYEWNAVMLASFEIDTLEMISFDQSNRGCWHHFEWQIPDTKAHNLRWYSSYSEGYPQANSKLWVDNITIYYTGTAYRKATIGKLKNGPSEKVYSIPGNGTGYVYFSMVNGAGQPLSDTTRFIISLSDQANRKYQETALFIKPGILRIAIPGSQLTSAEGVSDILTIQDNIQIGNTLYKLSSAPPTFSIEKAQQDYTRSFDFFADGSAGISGSIGSVGLGPSIAMAKISITGTAGIGLTVTVDQDNHLTLSRRFEAGIGADLEIPAVNTVVGKVSALFGAGISTKTILSQEISLTGLKNLTPDQVTMTQAGFVLETLSMGIGNFSPTLGIFLKAIKQSLFKTSGISQALKDALIKTSWGTENEGTFNAGFGANWGPIKFDIANVSLTGVLSGETANYPKGLPEIGNATGSNSITKATNFNFSLLNFSFENKDGVSLGSSNMSLFSGGTGMETSAEVFLNSSQQLQRLDLSLEGGGGLHVFASNNSIYYKTDIEIPGEYQNILAKNDFAINGLISDTHTIGLNSLTQNIPSIIDSVSNHFIKTPITIKTYKKIGNGKKLFLGVDLDAALVIGLGVKFGVDLKYYNELSYLKKYTLVYAGNNNYLMSSANYSNQMNSYQLSNYLTGLIHGAAGIVKTSFLSYLATVNKIINSGENFVLSGINSAGNFVGSVKGNIQKSGKWFVSTFSPNFNHLWKKSFAEPVVQNLYYSTRIQHKETFNNKTALVHVATTMVAVSDNMKISFIPDGQTVSVDSVGSAFTLKMIIDTAKLSTNGFTIADSSRIKIYRYNDSNGNWIMVGGTLHGDTLEAPVKYMANYLLGIELTDADDHTAPTIVDYSPKQDSTYTSYPMIYAKIQDNPYGVGVDWDKTFIIANGDTLNASFDPTHQMIFYNLSSKDSLVGRINIKVWTVDYNGNSDSINFSINLTITGINEVNTGNSFKLLQNYPNPFSSHTKINYSIPKVSDIKVIIFNSTGGYIKTLIVRRQTAGSYSIDFNRSGLPSGIYFYSFIAIPFDGSAGYRETRKMIVRNKSY